MESKMYKAFHKLQEIKELIDIIATTAKLLDYNVDRFSTYITITKIDQNHDSKTVTTISPSELHYIQHPRGSKKTIYGENSPHREKMNLLNEFLRSL